MQRFAIRTRAVDRFLTEEELRKNVPALFAGEKHETRSDRYTYLPSVDVLKQMEKAGFGPTYAEQRATKEVDRQAFTRHVVRFRHRDFLKPTRVGDCFPEVVMMNSHDGTSRYRLFGGLYRLICENGAVVGGGANGEVNVMHRGDIGEAVVKGSETVLLMAAQALEAANEWRGLEMTGDQLDAFAKKVVALRFTNREGKLEVEVEPKMVLASRREADNSNDLWTVFNRAQENIIRGGIQAKTGTGRKSTSREVTNIRRGIELNRELWDLTVETAKELQAA